MIKQADRRQEQYACACNSFYLHMVFDVAKNNYRINIASP